MRWVVPIALVCAVARVNGAIFLIFFLAGLVGLILLISRLGGLSRTRAALWVFAGYPWMGVAAWHLIWVIDWGRLGHLLRIAILNLVMADHLQTLIGITAVLYLLVIPVALLACVFLVGLEVITVVARRAPGQANQVTRLVLIPLGLWSGAVCLLAIESAWLAR